MKKIITTELPNSKADVRIVKLNDGGENEFSITGDTSASLGLLHFTHEWDIGVRMKNEKLEFLGGFEISSEVVSFSSRDADYFEYLHPNVLEDIETVIQKHFN